MLYELYPHQKASIDELRSSFAKGLKRPMLYAPVAFGKTVVAAHIVTGVLDKGKRVLFVAPYTALINQTARSFMAQGIPQPGIMQADHPWTNAGKRLQIASVQTLARRKIPDVDLVIVDEAHLQYSVICKLMDETDIPVIGLSGSPFSKGLGKYYDNLIHTTSMRQLIDDGFLSDYVAYSHDKPNLKGIKPSYQGANINEYFYISFFKLLKIYFPFFHWSSPGDHYIRYINLFKLSTNEFSMCHIHTEANCRPILSIL